VKSFPVVQVSGVTWEFFDDVSVIDSEPFAVLVFAWDPSGIVLANISNRGWCIPSGRVEVGESPIEAAFREAREEAQIEVSDLQPFGCYRLTSDASVRWSICYRAKVAGFHPFLPNEESCGRCNCAYDQLPGIYYLWNDLIAAVFAESRFPI
jgi:8-oxo-dGTP diphosphatase